MLEMTNNEFATILKDSQTIANNNPSWPLFASWCMAIELWMELKSIHVTVDSLYEYQRSYTRSTVQEYFENYKKR